jgi:hypothetical protein
MPKFDTEILEIGEGIAEKFLQIHPPFCLLGETNKAVYLDWASSDKNPKHKSSQI